MSSALNYAVSCCRMSSICDMDNVHSILWRQRWVFTIVTFEVNATHTCLFTGNLKWCIGCLWWEYSKDSSFGLLGRAAEQTSEVFRLLLVLITSVVAINLFWRNEWGKANRSFLVQ